MSIRELTAVETDVVSGGLLYQYSQCQGEAFMQSTLVGAAAGAFAGGFVGAVFGAIAGLVGQSASCAVDAATGDPP